jgi:hypothetical protein
MTDQKTFVVIGFGEVGEANMMGFAPFPGEKPWQQLEVNESTQGRFVTPMSDKKPERIVRIK